MRAVAAIWVLFSHADLSITHFLGPLSWGKQVIFNGYLGVDFFFVLSGFIIAFSSNRLAERGQGFSDYARARIIRIYTPYLPIGIFMYLLYLLLPDVSEGTRSVSLFTSLTLMPSISPPALSVAWTLVHEILFYAIFSLFFVSRKMLWLVLGIWTILIAIQYWIGGPVGREGWGYLLSPLNLSFLLGVIVYYVTRDGLSKNQIMIAGALGLIVLIVEANLSSPNRFLLALGFAGLIAYASSWEAQQRIPHKLFLFLGSASYSIYLVHNEVLSIAIRILKRLPFAISPVNGFVIISAAGLLAGVAYYYLYERRALNFLKQLFPSSSGIKKAITP